MRATVAALLAVQNPQLDEILGRLGASMWEAEKGTMKITALPAPWQTLLGPRRYRRWAKLIYPPDLQRVTEFVGAPAGEASPPLDYRVIDEAGELVWVRHWLLSQAAPKEGPERIVGLVQNISALKQLERECIHVSERECNRIGQELHDDICQVLAGLSYLLQVMGKKVFEALPELRPEFHELNQQLCVGMERTRTLAHGLFPAKLAGIGIKRALQDLAEQTMARFPIQVSVESSRYLPQHSPIQILQVYRIAQEALSNSVKHGSASHAQLVLRSSPRAMELTVRDDGVGLPKETERPRPRGIGLHVMEYRAGLLAGALTLEPRKPRGVEVKLVYPRLARKDLERLVAP